MADVGSVSWVDTDPHIPSAHAVSGDRNCLLGGCVSCAISTIVTTDWVVSGTTRAILCRVRSLYGLSEAEWPISEQAFGDALLSAADMIACYGIRVLCIRLDGGLPVWVFLVGTPTNSVLVDVGPQ